MADKRSQRGTATKRNRIDLWRWGGLAVALALLGGLTFVLTSGNADEPDNDADAATDPVFAIASDNAGTEIDRLTGSRHVVYHSTEPLPSNQTPRADGRPTLVWFSGTWCSFCRQMEGFAHQTANDYLDRLAFVEKSVDHDSAAVSSYSVRGTPTFVLIDANGDELSRFHFLASEAEFREAIEGALEDSEASNSG